MAKKLASFEDYIQSLKLKNTDETLDTYDMYKYKSGTDLDRDYYSDLSSLYAATKKKLSGYGSKSTALANNGLQSSGYSAYIDSKARSEYASKYNDLTAKRISDENKMQLGYSDYLDQAAKEKASLKKSVLSSLIDGNIIKLDDAIAYGMSAGLSKDDANEVGQTVYSITKQKVLNGLMEQVVSLGLDSTGAALLAEKMGISHSDAVKFGKEAEEMLKYYANISDAYLKYLENQANTTIYD